MIVKQISQCHLGILNHNSRASLFAPLQYIAVLNFLQIRNLELPATCCCLCVRSISKMVELLRKVFLKACCKTRKMGQLVEVWNWWANAVDFNVWLTVQTWCEKQICQCAVLADFIIIVNQDKYDPTSCSTFLSSLQPQDIWVSLLYNSPYSL